MLMPSETEMVANSRGVPPASAIPALAASTWKSWVMLQGVCSPFMLTTPTIGLAIAASSSPIARMKARCGARSSPSVVTRDRGFFMDCSFLYRRPYHVRNCAPGGDDKWLLPYSIGATMVGCLNCATSSLGSIPVSA